MQSEYYEKVVDAVRFYTRTAREMRPFETLVKLMYQRPISPQFQVRTRLQLGCNYPIHSNQKVLIIDVWLYQETCDSTRMNSTCMTLTQSLLSIQVYCRYRCSCFCNDFMKVNI